MTTQTITTCDFKVRGRACGEGEADQVTVVIGRERIRGDLCAQHQVAIAEELVKLGLSSLGMQTDDGKTTKGYRGADGQKFSAKDVRKWLISQGKEPHPSGRLPNELIEEYRRAHAN